MLFMMGPRMRVIGLGIAILIAPLTAPSVAAVITVQAVAPVNVQQLEREAERGDVRAQVRLGELYLLGRDVPKDVQRGKMWLLRAAEHGDNHARTGVGILYLEGLGVPQSDKIAAEWFEKAAEERHAAAQYNLGYLYSNGRGVPRDLEKGWDLIEKAAKSQHSAAQYSLGTRYLSGNGVERSNYYAYIWLRLAELNGYRRAVGLPEGLAKHLSLGEREKAAKIVEACIRRRGRIDLEDCGDR